MCGFFLQVKFATSLLDLLLGGLYYLNDLTDDVISLAAIQNLTVQRSNRVDGSMRLLFGQYLNKGKIFLCYFNDKTRLFY